MKITLKRRLALLAGLVLVPLSVFAIGVQAAQALPTSAGTPLAGTQGRGGVNLAPVASVTPLAGTQGRGGVNLAPVASGTPLAGTQGRGGVNLAPLTPASVMAVTSGTSSTTAWIVFGSAAFLLIVGLAAWALVRGARASPAYCAQHPEEGLCIAA